MKKILTSGFIGVVFLGLVCQTGCRQSDIRRVEIHTPGIRSEECSRLAVDSLRSLRGIDLDSIAFDLDEGVMTLEYDSMTLGLKNIETALNAAGFDANEMKADPKAVSSLPPECRVPSD